MAGEEVVVEVAADALASTVVVLLSPNVIKFQELFASGNLHNLVKFIEVITQSLTVHVAGNSVQSYVVCTL